MSTRLFGTDGVRGIANADLTPELAFRIGEAAVRFLGDRGEPRFVVGRDTRRSGIMLESALVAGIASAGGEALLCGVVPTPAVALLVRELGAEGGVVISASHNAPEYNGIKLFSRDGYKLPDDLEDDIEQFLISGEPAGRPVGSGVGGASLVPDALDRYIAHAVSTLGGDRLDGLRVAIDCGHGAAAIATPRAFEALGATVHAINTDSNGDDINVACGSTDLGALSALVAGGGFQMGIAHDGDADRVLAVDETGEEVDGDRIMAICAVDMKASGSLGRDTVVSTVMCNLGFEHAMREHGINLVKTKVGDRYVLEQMQTMDAVLGGEQSGHIIFLEHNTTGDGLVTALQLARVLARSGRTLSELGSVMQRFPQVLINVRVADKAHLTASAAIADAVHAEEAVLGESGRVLVRASGTEPLVRVMVEASDEVLAREVAERLVTVVKGELG